MTLNASARSTRGERHQRCNAPREPGVGLVVQRGAGSPGGREPAGDEPPGGQGGLHELVAHNGTVSALSRAKRESQTDHRPPVAAIRTATSAVQAR